MAKKRKVHIRENSWLARLAARKLGYAHVAMVIGHTIHLHNTTAAAFLSNRRWLLHELKHVSQYERHGYFGFLWRYLADYRRNGYYQNIFEAEARQAENESSLLDSYLLPDAAGKK